MGFRVRLRKTFGSSSKKNSTSTVAAAADSSDPREPHYTSRTDIEYYKPNEIPKSKYRGKIDPAHQASLAAFSFGDAFAAAKRRSSLALSGTFSPGGTKSQSRAASRAQSRAASRVPSVRPSIDVQRVSALRMESQADSDHSGSSGSASREKSADSATGGPANNDTASTSLSEQPTVVPSAPVESTSKLTQNDSGVDVTSMASAGLTKHITAHDTPFTAEELERAMTRVTLQPRDFEVGVTS